MWNLSKILLLSFCWIGTVQGTEPFLIAQVDRGIVPQTFVLSGWLPVRLAFEYQGSSYTVRLQIKSEKFNRYTQQMARRPRPNNLVARSQLVEKGAKEIAPLTAAMKRAAPDQQPKTLASFALAFVQSLPYKFDALTTPFDDAWRAPLQTLIDREIDCEDSSILYSSLLSGLGINNALIIVPNHMLVGVEGQFSGAFLRHDRKKYYLAETTGTGWPIGNAPEQYENATALLLPVQLQYSTPSTHILPSDNGTSPPSGQSPSSNKIHLLLLMFFIIGTSLFLVWVWLKDHKPLSRPTHWHSDDFDDDPYKDYD
jgi:hypothetical protein